MHQSVLCDEVVELLQPRPGSVIVDATAGLGGHAERLVRAGARVVGVEWDHDAASQAEARLGPSVEIVRENFAHLPSILESRNLSAVDGILADLGISSLQINTASRGFSFQREGPLDMRMSRHVGGTAADLLRSIGRSELERILREYGEEPRARRIAAAVIEEREEKGSDAFGTTRGLAGFVERLLGRRGRAHPATRTFQALRIAVNRELDNLKKFLGVFDKYLGDRGRCCVISFHSLEDRLVKRAFRSNPGLRVVTKKPLRPSRAEVLENPRARSAKLRCVEKQSAPAESGERKAESGGR